MMERMADALCRLYWFVYESDGFTTEQRQVLDVSVRGRPAIWMRGWG